jgi:tRNA A-37 threonylcarbamoyl transferase component Bud32
MSFKKIASSLLEIELQRVASTHGFTPKVLSQNGLEFEMEKIDGLCLADMYGEEVDDLPNWIWEEIVRILTVLYTCEGIEYVDITPYNFIEVNGKVWIIDFGHAYFTKPKNWFLRDILKGERSWNPDFK